MYIFELTFPLEKRHTAKNDKYAHFLCDLDQHKTKVTCFEIGSRGYISPDNHERLKICISSASQTQHSRSSRRTFQHTLSIQAIQFSLEERSHNRLNQEL